MLPHDPFDPWGKPEADLAPRSTVSLREYLDKAGLVAALVGSGLTLTGLVNVWIGFALLFLALGVLLYDITGWDRFKLRTAWRLSSTSIIMVGVIVLLHKPINEYAKSKEEHPLTVADITNALSAHPPQVTVVTNTNESSAFHNLETLEQQRAQRIDRLSTSTQAIGFEVLFETNNAFMQDFNEKLATNTLLQPFKNSINTFVDHNPPEVVEAALASTLGSIMPCDTTGISSASSFTISEHPFIFFYMFHRPIDGHCTFVLQVGPQPASAGRFTDLPSNAYILDSPIGRGYFALRSQILASALHALNQNEPVKWQSFFFEGPRDIYIALEPLTCSNRTGRTTCDSISYPASMEKLKRFDLQKTERLLPKTITLRLLLQEYGPTVVKKYTLIPEQDPKYSGVKFTWRLSYYDEVQGVFQGGNPPPPDPSMPRGPRPLNLVSTRTK